MLNQLMSLLSLSVCVPRPVINRNADVMSVNNDNDDTDACIENIMLLFHECECSVTDNSSMSDGCNGD